LAAVTASEPTTNLRRTTLTPPRSRACGIHPLSVFLFFVLAASVVSERALAEKVIAQGDDWQVFTDGRVGAFASWVYGDGFPQSTYTGTAPDNCTQVRDVKGGGFGALIDQGPGVGCQPDQGTINSMRVRSGFIGNQLGLGVRAQLKPWMTLTAYIQIWAYVESESRQKNRPNPTDVRQGYLKLESWWGSVLVGRTRALFSRGATDINSLYAHRWGVGWVGGNPDGVGPTVGQIGFGVMGSGFAAGIIYASPVLAGFQLTVGFFEPIALYGNGSLTRTKYLRPELELTYERKIGEIGKFVLFGNGVYQKAYKGGYCKVPEPGTPEAEGYDYNQLGCEATAKGLGAGGRLELGLFRLGVAGHWGKGLGTNYALESTDASTDLSGNLRDVDGYYVQTQFVLGKIDVFGGAGFNRIFLTDYDKEPPKADAIAHSVLKGQIGYNSGVVYHPTPYLHLDLDFFRAEAHWFYGERQVVYATNAGMTFNW
jgi:hypothetical protein